MKRVLFLLFILFEVALFATPSLLSPRKSITLSDNVTGKESSFISDGQTYLKIESDPDEVANYPTWYVKVSIVGKDGKKTHRKSFKTSRKTLFENVGLKLPKGQAIVQSGTNKEVYSKAGLSFIIEGRYKKGNWDHLQIYFVNSDGAIVDHEGKTPPESSFKLYKISTKMFDKHMAKGMITSLAKVNEDPSKLFYCPLSYSEETISPSAPKISLRPKPRPKPKAKAAPVSNTPQYEGKRYGEKSAYQTIMEKRRWFLKTYPTEGKCLSALRNHEKTRKDNIWSKSVSLKERAQKIYKLSKQAYSSMVNHPEAVMKKNVGTGYSETFNPHMIHPMLSPELMTCIAFQETKGKLDPQVMNYSYCQRSKAISSTAFGLSMITGDTMKKLLKYPSHPGETVNALPVTSIKTYGGKSIREDLNSSELTHLLSESPVVQLEMAARILNYNMKHFNWQHKIRGDGAKTLKTAVLKYDADDAVKYESNVINTCLPCMKKISKNGGDPISCHNRMK